MSARRKVIPETLPESHLRRIRDMGLHVVCYQNEAVEVNTGNREWLPEHIVGDNDKTLITWETGGDYAFSGWTPRHAGMSGGRYTNIHNALSWVQRARDVRAGVRTDFLGV